MELPRGNARAGWWSKGHNLVVRIGAVLVLTALVALLYAGQAWADTFTVTNTADSGAGSLREAITKANSRAGADEIVFAEGVSGTITLGSALPVVTDPEGLVIDGGEDITVSGNHTVGEVLVVGGSREEGRRSWN